MLKNIVLLLLPALLLGACKQSDTKRTVKLPHSIGRLGEVAVVGDDMVFQGSVKSGIDTVLSQTQPQLFNVESWFNVYDIRPDLFKSVAKSYHTIWVLKVQGDAFNTKAYLPHPYNILSDSLKNANDTAPVRLYLKKNVWAYPQQVLFIYAKSHMALYEFLVNNRESLLQRTLDMERENFAMKLESEKQDTISKFLSDNFGFSMAVPDKFRIAVLQGQNNNKFAWIRRETPNIGQSLLIYSVPYTNKNQLLTEEIVVRRDSIAKTYVPGELKGSYMATELEFPFLDTAINFKGSYAVEMHALWRMRGGLFMGGPFYSVTIADTAHSRLLTVEGFVYSPEYDKTQYIRELETIISTFKWTK